jgi:hypothetical protein
VPEQVVVCAAALPAKAASTPAKSDRRHESCLLIDFLLFNPPVIAGPPTARAAVLILTANMWLKNSL